MAPRLTSALRRLGASTPTSPITGTGGRSRGRVDLDRNRAFDAIDEQDVPIGLKARNVDLRVTIDDLRIFGGDPRLGERRFERAFPCHLRRVTTMARPPLKFCSSRESTDDCTTFNSGERIALAKRGDD